MLAKEITFTDYNGTERTETHFFHLTKAEILEMELGVDGGMQAMLERIIAAKDGKQIVETFKNMIKRAYGVKTPDGRKFIKNDEVLDDFMQTEAYSELFIELATNADAAGDFVRGIIPADLAREVDEARASEALPAPNVTPITTDISGS